MEYVRCKRYAQITQITHSKYKRKDDDNTDRKRERAFYIIKLEYHKMRVLTKKNQTLTNSQEQNRVFLVFEMHS